MALQVWLPLNGNLENKGVMGDITITSLGLESVDGKLGKGYRFDNGSQTGRGISLDTNFVGKLGTQNSIAVWVKPYGNHVHYNGTIISSGNWNSSCWAFGLSQDNSSVDVFGDWYNQYISCPVPVNQWTHLACVNDNGTCKVYKNGIYVGSRTNANLYRSDASNTCIGRETYAGGYFGFNGAIQDVRIYDHCLSPAEVKEISKGLVLHYPLNDPYVEPTTNIAKYPTPGSSYSPGWDSTLHQGAISVSNWSGGYNSGVGDPTHGYHAMWKLIDNIPTIVFQDKNSSISQTHRWLGISGGGITTSQITSNTTYTISFEAKSDVAGKQISTGLYYKQSSSGSNNFHDGCSVKTVTTDWKRYSWTYTTGTVYSIGSVYIYGHYGTEGISYVRNIQVEVKDHATPYTSSSRNETVVYDCSGYGNNGTVTSTSAPTISNDSKRYDKSYYFVDNSKYIYSNIYMPGGNQITMSYWFKSNTTGFSSYHIPLCINSSNYEASINPSGGLRGGFVINGSRVIDDNGSVLLNNQWHMCTVTYDGSTIKRYIDGTLVGSTSSSGTLSSGNMELTIGRYGSSNTTYGNKQAYMSDVRVYTTTLLASDIQELYNTGAKISKNDTLMCYELKED